MTMKFSFQLYLRRHSESSYQKGISSLTVQNMGRKPRNQTRSGIQKTVSQVPSEGEVQKKAKKLEAKDFEEME
jgi:hypothetical protein